MGDWDKNEVVLKTVPSLDLEWQEGEHSMHLLLCGDYVHIHTALAYKIKKCEREEKSKTRNQVLRPTRFLISEDEECHLHLFHLLKVQKLLKIVYIINFT